MSSFQILLGFYVGTLIVNIIVTATLYWTERTSVQRTLLVYWLGILAAIFGNGLIKELSFELAIIACTGTFFSQMILASFIAELHATKLPLKAMTIYYAISVALGMTFAKLGFRFEVYALATGLGAISPVFVVLYLIRKNKKNPFTTVQKLLYATAFLMTLHYADWAFVRPHAELLIPTFVAAFIVLYILSLLTAMAANEHTLQLKNERLEEEVQHRALKLTEAERQLWESNKFASLGRMAGGVAHEINTPLTTLSLQLESLQAQAERNSISSEDLIKETTNAMNVIDRIAKITSSLRKVARDRVTIEMHETSLREVVFDTLSFCTERINALKIGLTTNVPDDPCKMTCNPVEISQVILNLLNNAIDAVEPLEKREIKIALIEKPLTYEISVEDSGQIDPAIAHRIMDPFFTTKPIGKGTGLGLSISKSFAESHGGRLTLDPAATHTRFVLELPKSAESR